MRARVTRALALVAVVLACVFALRHLADAQQVLPGGNTVNGVTSVSGTAPISATTGASPVVSISAATDAGAGSMSASDKAKLDTVSSGANTVNGVTQVAGNCATSTGGGVAVEKCMITTGVQYHIAARTGITLDAGTAVSAWNDVDPNSANVGVSAVQATGSAEPALVSADSTFGNQSSVQFTAANSQVLVDTNDTLTVTTPFTVYMIGSFADTGVARNAITFYSPNTFEFVSSSTTQWGVYINGTGAEKAGTPDTNPHLFVVVQAPTGGTSAFYVDNTQSAVLTWSGANAGSIGGHYYVGSSDGAPYFNGKIAEFIVYNAQHTAGQRAAMAAWVKALYGLSVQ